MKRRDFEFPHFSFLYFSLASVTFWFLDSNIVFRGFLNKILHTFLICCMCAVCPSHLILLDLSSVGESYNHVSHSYVIFFAWYVSVACYDSASLNLDESKCGHIFLCNKSYFVFLYISQNTSALFTCFVTFYRSKLVLPWLGRHYSEILQALSTAASKERHAGTLDNICGALAKLILTNISGVPMAQVSVCWLWYLISLPY